MSHRLASLVLALVVTAFAATAATARTTAASPLTIYAAASLAQVFKVLDPAPNYSFAGSNALETQIRNGAPADIFASAAPLNTQRLYKAGIVDKPVTFTANRLALIVPKSNPAGIRSIYDLRSKPVKLVVAAPAVPVGGYTLTGAEEDGALRRAEQGRKSRVRRQGRHGQGCARPGRRGVRLRDGRASRQRPGDRGSHPRLGSAARALRDRRGLEVAEQGCGPGVDHHAAVGERPNGARECRFPAGAEAIDVGRFLFRSALVLATGVALAFLVLPVVAIFARVPPGELLSALGTEAAKDALVVTVKTNLVSMALILTFGTPAAYWIATREPRLRDVVVTLVELPLVLPPAVAGIGLLAAFGRLGLLGGTMDALGIDIAFTQTAVVLAVTFVASPFYVRTAVAAFEAVDPALPAAARTLGAGPGRVFFRVALPLAAGGLGAGAALAFARGIGEFGATIMFAGSLEGRTQTLSLAIYEQFDLDFDVALAISALLVIVSGTVLLSVKLLTRWRSGSTTPIPFAPSTRTSS